MPRFGLRRSRVGAQVNPVATVTFTARVSIKFEPLLMIGLLYYFVNNVLIRTRFNYVCATSCPRLVDSCYSFSFETHKALSLSTFHWFNQIHVDAISIRFAII